ncbi:hypothetical protein DES49_2415 [Halospina denitrificans]|uniref:Uncharacterized protein n=1 Tax=Halospina denitrificans TaxID=332522 RepID=A0A4V3EQB4_9GAMM|nr:hypothetical protein [Halospina denitrificans]TDT39488.1 hypothetical protein DES49_2415 [Halospina denitrificans]
MRFNFSYGDLVAVVGTKDSFSGCAHESLINYENSELYSLDYFTKESLNDVFYRTNANLVIFLDRLLENRIYGVRDIVKIMSDHRAIGALVGLESPYLLPDPPWPVCFFRPRDYLSYNIDLLKEKSYALRTQDAMPIAIYRSALKRVGYLSKPSTFSPWLYAMMKFNRFFAIGGLPFIKTVQSERYRISQDEKIRFLLTLFHSENDPVARQTYLATAYSIIKDQNIIFRIKTIIKFKIAS